MTFDIDQHRHMYRWWTTNWLKAYTLQFVMRHWCWDGSRSYIAYCSIHSRCARNCSAGFGSDLDSGSLTLEVSDHGYVLFPGRPWPQAVSPTRPGSSGERWHVPMETAAWFVPSSATTSQPGPWDTGSEWWVSLWCLDKIHNGLVSARLAMLAC